MKLCEDDHSKLKKARQKIFDAHISDPNVSGVGIGVRQRAGELTGEPAVVVLVAKKRREVLVSRRRLLPRTVEVDGTTYPVDVVQGGPFSVGAQSTVAPPSSKPADVITERMRPPLQGASISNIVDGPVAGTLGLFVIDNKDDTVCVLSCSHVLARLGRGNVGEAILQPGGYDGGGSGDKIATLKRWAPLGETGVDAAIAQLTDQSAYTLEVAHNLMPPVSAEHPVVGMVVAGDGFGNSLLTQMDTTLAALDVRLPISGAGNPTTLPCASSGSSRIGIAQAEFLMNIEKVGRTTGYTSSMIAGYGIWAEVSTPVGPVIYKDLIWTLFFSQPGDSGSVVFAGGDGRTLVIPPFFLFCPVLAVLGTYYNLPLTDNNTLADQARDEFFLQTITGKMLVELTYVNSQQIVDRLQNRTATPTEQQYAYSYYTKYHDFMANVLGDPNSTEVVTQENLDDASFVITGLLQSHVLNNDEANVAYTLHDQCLKPTLGMNRQEVQAYMNNPMVAEQVYEAVAMAPGIEWNGQYTQQPPEPTA